MAIQAHLCLHKMSLVPEQLQLSLDKNQGENKSIKPNKSNALNQRQTKLNYWHNSADPNDGLKSL